MNILVPGKGWAIAVFDYQNESERLDASRMLRRLLELGIFSTVGMSWDADNEEYLQGLEEANERVRGEIRRGLAEFRLVRMSAAERRWLACYAPCSNSAVFLGQGRVRLEVSDGSSISIVGPIALVDEIYRCLTEDGYQLSFIA